MKLPRVMRVAAPTGKSGVVLYGVFRGACDLARLVQGCVDANRSRATRPSCSGLRLVRGHPRQQLQQLHALRRGEARSQVFLARCKGSLIALEID